MNREEIKRNRRKRKRIILYIRIYTSLITGIFLLAGLITIILSDYNLKLAAKKLADPFLSEEKPIYDRLQNTEDESASGNREEVKQKNKSDVNQGTAVEYEPEDKRNSGNMQASDNASGLNEIDLYGMDIDMKYINSPNAILMELDKGKGTVIAENDADKRVFPASMTKIMTAILVIENIPDLNKKIILPSAIFYDLYAKGASMAGFEPGEEAAVMDLLYGILLPSGAECCLALAEQVAGSERDFTVLMNEKAEELGMMDTQFRNSTGLHDEQHYTTVNDMAVLLKYALQNDRFRNIFTSSRYSIKPTNKHPQGFTVSSTMFNAMDHTDIPGGQILGGKTGYTDEAGLCLASLAYVGGTDYILITAGAKGNHNTDQFNIEDAFYIYNQIVDVKR